MVLFKKFQCPILNKEPRCSRRKPAPTAKHVNETIFGVAAPSEFLAECSHTSEPSWHYIEWKNCPCEPSQLTKWWDIIHLCGFKKFWGGLSQSNRPLIKGLATVPLPSPGLHGLAASVGHWYFFLSLLVVSQTQACVPRESCWLPSHSIPSCILPPQWCRPNGVHFCLNLCLTAEWPLPVSLCCPWHRLLAQLADNCLSAWLPGSPPQCPPSGLIESPRNGSLQCLLPTSWYESLSLWGMFHTATSMKPQL